VIAVTVSLPEAIQGYFRAVDDDDTDALVACFDHDAEVADEGNVRRGPDEIRARREQTTFPGSPVEMPYRFTLRGGLIGRLDIDP
jgi:hypothetical protein